MDDDDRPFDIFRGFACRCGHPGHEHNEGGCTHACTCSLMFGHHPPGEGVERIRNHRYVSEQHDEYTLRCQCGVTLTVSGLKWANEQTKQHHFAHRVARQRLRESTDIHG